MKKENKTRWFERNPILTYCFAMFLCLFFVEMLMHVLFFVKLLPPNPIYMTSLEKRNSPILMKNDQLESKIIIYEDHIPRRGKGAANYMQRGIPIHDVNFDDEGKRIDSYQGDQTQDKIIGVFGDSFAEALQVGQLEDFSSLAEIELRKDGLNVDFRNYGLGATGTSQQYTRYLQLKEKGAHFDKVILLAFLYNDIADNHSVISRPFEHYEQYPYFEIENGNLVRHDRVTKIFEREGFKSFLRNYSHIASIINNVRQIMKIQAHPFSPQMDKSVYETVCRQPQDLKWKEAWAVTEAILKKWKEDCDRAGEDFIVITYTNRFGEINEKSRAITACDYPRLRVHDLAVINKIKSLDFDLIAKSFILDHKTPEPYFSFQYDSHLNSLGHQVLGHTIAKYLKEK